MVNQDIRKLLSIILEEIKLYSEVRSLENAKSAAVIKRDGKKLMQLSEKQEKILNSVSELEEQREKLVDSFVIPPDMRIYSGRPTLRDIAFTLDKKDSGGLLDAGRSLRSIITEISAIQKRNLVLVNDNMEFYRLVMAGIKESAVMKNGYERDGREGETRLKSVLINQTA